jgi:hypothetical protein
MTEGGDQGSWPDPGGAYQRRAVEVLGGRTRRLVTVPSCTASSFAAEFTGGTERC